MLDSLHSSRKHSEERRVFPAQSEIVPDADLNSAVNRETSTHDLVTGGGNETSSKGKPKSEGTQTTQNNKVTALKTAQLTESSSSGSVTDSICTAYEQNQEAPENGDNNNHKKTNKPLTSSKSEVSVIGSMFNQLLQFGSKSTTKAEPSVPDASFEPFRYSYDDFSSVDHRLKLYLYQNVFDDEAGLKWLVRGRIYDESSTEPALNGFEGLFVISTTKFYVLKAVKEER